jgi:aminoglycoside phosphotransferase (APT) family kinase protein
MPADPNVLDLPSLERWLAANLPGFRGPLAATKFKGGQSNPTWRLDTGAGPLVLRRKPPGQLLASAHAVDREYRVLRALHGHGVPVAAPLALCTDESVIGSMFYLMTFVEGRIFWDPALPEVEAAQRATYHEAILRTLAAIHAVDPAAVGLGDYGKPGNYFARQIARWTGQYRAAQTEALEPMEQLIAWLPANCPPDDGSARLVHGDFRIDNLIFHPTEPRVLAVVDWELSTLGNPLADLSYYCMALRLPRNPVIPGLAGLDREALGIPSEDALLACYAAAAGSGPVRHWEFCLAFNFFRLAAIAQGVLARSRQGNASNEQAATVGRMTRLVAAAGVAMTTGTR